MSERSAHWEAVYQQKPEEQLSWHQDEPGLSLALIREFASPHEPVIDIGGGSSVLAGRLVALGYTSVTVLDISESALERARRRIGEHAAHVRWVAADITTSPALGQFGLWHDRAVFHFLTDEHDRRAYATCAAHSVRPGGHVVLATFAPDGSAAGCPSNATTRRRWRRRLRRRSRSCGRSAKRT